MPVTGPSLSFDPRYLEFAIAAWQRGGFASMPAADLEAAVAETASSAFTELALMGLAEERVKPSLVKSAITLLKSLKLAKSTTTGPKNARMAKLVITPLGREVLSEPPATGGIRPRLVSLLVKQSPPLAAVLKSLDEHGPLSRPVASPVPGAPSKGAAFNRSLLHGLAEYATQSGDQDTQQQARPGTSRARPTPGQQLKAAAERATKRHPVSAIAGVEKIIQLASAMGLLWIDAEQVNEALGIESIGTATMRRDGDVLPNTPEWRTIGPQFTDLLLRTHLKRMDGSGFSPISALRGGVGRVLRLSSPVVDALICRAREAGDRGESPVLLHFEPNDDLSYAPGRKPLIWERTAFDSVEVRRPSQTAPVDASSAARTVR